MPRYDDEISEDDNDNDNNEEGLYIFWDHQIYLLHRLLYPGKRMKVCILEIQTFNIFTRTISFAEKPSPEICDY